MSKLTQYVRHLAVVAIATLAAQCAWAVDVISINFGSGQTNASMSDQQGSDGSLLKDVPASSWNDFNDNSATDSAVAHRWNGESQEDLSDVTVSFSGRGGNWYPHAAQRSTASRFLNGYIDDNANSQVTITVKNVPYSTYGVIVYYNGDNSGHRFKPVEVNGARYSIQQGKTIPVASDAKTPIWGLPEQTTVGYGKNAIRITDLTDTDLTIKPGIFETVSGSQCRGTVAAVQIYDPSTVEEVVINKDDVFSASAAEALDEADIYNLTIPADGTFSVDADLTRSYNIISTGKVILKGTNLTAANVSKLNDLTTGFIFRVEGDLSAGTTLAFGAGTYSFENAKITTAYGADYKVLVQDGETFHLAETNQQDGRTSVSFDIRGGDVTIGKTDGYGSYWYAANGTTYNQTGGTVTCTANGTGTSGSGNGLLLGWSGTIGAMNISGGTLQVPNSSLNFWSNSTALNLSGDGHIKAKGVYRGSGSGQTVTISENGVFELGSIGWTTVPLTMNGGTFKAYENTTMAGAITMGSAANIEVPANVELKLTGSVTGEGVITKKGEGVLNVGSLRPTMDVVEGSVKIVATPTEIVAGKLTLTVPQDATAASDDKVAVYDSEGNEIEITDVSIEGTTVTIILKTLPSIDADTTISSLALDPAAAGLIVVEGGATEEESITVSFDAALPEGVTMEINGFVKFVAGEGIDIPYAKMTFGEGCTLIFDSIAGYEIPAGAAVIAGTASGTITNAGTLKIGTMTSGSINNIGTLNVTGDSTFKLANTGTVNLVSGTSTISADSQAIKGTINIAYGATYKCDSNDQVPYSGSTTTTVNVRGTLNMQSHRWTLGGADTINLYGGCTVSGSGDKDGIFDLYRDGNVINVQAGEGDQAGISVVTIPAPVRARNANGNIFIAQGMKLALTGGIKNGGDVAGATINMNGNGRLTGTIPLYGGTINLGTSVGTIDAKFVAESGDTALKVGEGAGYTDITTTDTAEEPIIWIKSGATLQLYVKDFSSWTGASTEHAWVKNEGVLNIREIANDKSRYFRGHLVMKPGTTTTLYGTSQNFIVYGGNSDVAKAQMIVPASEEASTATFAGEGTIQLNVNGSGGTNGSAWDIGANSTLDVQTKVIGGEALVKYGAGTLKLSNAENTYTGAVTLNAGTIVSAITLNVTCGDANMKLAEPTTDGDYTIYSLIQRDATTIQANDFAASGFTLNGAAVTLIDGDIVEFPSTIGNAGQWDGVGSQVVVGHEVIINKSMNWKANISKMTVGSGVVAYMVDGTILSGATISGDGKFQLQWSKTITGNTTISTAEVGYGAGGADGSETYPKFTLAEGATLTIAEQESGRVVSGVTGKVPSYAEGKYTLVTATYTITIPAVEHAEVVVTVNGTEVTPSEEGAITVNHGDKVVVTYTAAEGYTMETVTKTIESAGANATIDTTEVTPVEVKTYVAQIGETKYETLQAALDAVAEATTVTLIADTSANARIIYTGTHAITLDLNGKTITSTADVALINKGGEMTITGEGTIDASNATDPDNDCVWAHSGNIIIKNGTFINKSTTSATVYLTNASVFTIEGGAFKNLEPTFVYGTTTETHYFGVLNVNNKSSVSQLVVKGGSFLGTDPAKGDDNLGGTFVANGYESVYNAETKTYTVSEKTGPKDWSDVNDDTEVTDIVSSETAAELADSTVTAKEIAAWATANGVEFSTTTTIPVNALIFNCAIADAPVTEAAAEEAAAEILEDYLEEATKDVDLAALLKEIPAEGKEITVEGYPMATIKLVPSKKLDSTETAKFFQLSIELK